MFKNYDINNFAFAKAGRIKHKEIKNYFLTAVLIAKYNAPKSTMYPSIKKEVLITGRVSL